jgi:PAS domain S-box-containing protein
MSLSSISSAADDEIYFDEESIIVSKTDRRGIITYANDVFIHVSGYAEAQLIGQPHNILRHSDMPACVFRLLWDTLEAGREIFAYVLNRSREGRPYWVFAHVTPSFDSSGQIVGYHSSRRVPYPDALPKVKALYAELLRMERAAASRREGIEVSLQFLNRTLEAAGISYGEFVFSLSASTRLGAAA